MVEILKKEGRVTDFEFQMINKKSSVRDCVTSLNVYSNQGIVEGSILDITERKLAEQELRDSEEKYHTLIENMLEGFAYCHMLYDEEGRPEDWIYLSVQYCI